MQITTEHAKSQRVRTRKNVKERLLLSWIALQSGHVIHGHTQVSAFVKANFADAAVAFLDQARMSAGKAAQGVVRQMLGQFRRAFGRHLVQNRSERSCCNAQWHNCLNPFVVEIPMRNYPPFDARRRRSARQTSSDKTFVTFMLKLG